MSILTKLAVGAMAVAGVYALKGKKGAASKNGKVIKERPTGVRAPAKAKLASRRSRPKAAAASHPAATGATPGSAKAKIRKQRARRSGAKRA